MKLLFYKGRWIDNSSATLWDNIICLVTWSKYSHVEVSINEYNGWHDCWSSSTRDDGVRKTRIYVDPSKWHIIPTDKPIELKLFEDNENASYDYIGLLGTEEGIDLKDPDVAAVLGYLVSKGVLTPERMNEVLG